MAYKVIWNNGQSSGMFAAEYRTETGAELAAETWMVEMTGLISEDEDGVVEYTAEVVLA